MENIRRVLISIRGDSRIAATMPSSAHAPWYRDKQVWFRIVELLVILSATFIAWRSLERNTDGILASSSSQLFYADTQLEKEEYEGADKPVWTIYSRPHTDDPTAYCQQLLAAIAKHSKSIAAIPNADQLNNKIIELNPPDDEIQDIAELRRVKSHLTSILNELHSAYDFWSKDILTKKELETWIGSLDIIGPHPVFLAEIQRWQRAKFMSRNFAEMLQIELLKNPLNKRIIDKFYPQMDSRAFLEGLPEYGKHWSD
jgi:hypothetical protein